MHFGGTVASTPNSRKLTSVKLLDACFKFDESKFFDTYPKEELDQCNDCCQKSIQKGIYSEGNGYGELNIAKFLQDKIPTRFQLIFFRFSFIMESPRGTIFSFGPLRIYTEAGLLKIALGDNVDQYIPMPKEKKCTAFPENVCDGGLHRIQVRMCFSPSCPKSNFAQIMVDGRTYRLDSFKRNEHKPKSRITKMYIGGLQNDHNQSFKGSFLSYNVGDKNAGVIEFWQTTGWTAAADFKKYKGIRPHSAPRYNRFTVQ